MSNRGFTLFEIILAVLLLAIAISPMVSSFAPALFSTGGVERAAVFTNQARGTLNRVASLDFKTLRDNQGDPADLSALLGSAEEAAKETFSFKGTTYTPSVAITDEGGGDGGLLKITVSVEETGLTILKAEY